MNFQPGEVEETVNGNEEQNLPKLYSKTVILVFSIFFSTIFAAALLFSNLKSLGKKSAAWWVLLFAVGYLFATAIIMAVFNLSPTLSVIANVIGAAILNEYFWNKYIGSETEFEKKSWTRPVAISIFIVLVMFSLMMMAQ
jgi:hypothetical protein